MGSLFSAIRDLLENTFGKNEANAIIVGLDAAGKTSMLYKLKFPDQSVSVLPTIGFNVESIIVGKLKIQAWDLGGGSRVRALHGHYFTNVDGVFAVIDANDMSREDEVEKYIFEEVLGDIRLEGVPTVFFLNKQDLPHSISKNDFIEGFEMKDRMNLWNPSHWMVQPCCALSGEGLIEGFKFFADLHAKLKKKPGHGAIHILRSEVEHLTKTYSEAEKILDAGWTKKSHLLFPTQFRESVRTMVLIRLRKGKEWVIPDEVLEIVFSYVECWDFGKEMTRKERFEEKKKIVETFKTKFQKK